MGKKRVTNKEEGNVKAAKRPAGNIRKFPECFTDIQKKLTKDNFKTMLSEYKLIDTLYRASHFEVETRLLMWLITVGKVIEKPNIGPDGRVLEFEIGGRRHSFGQLEWSLITGCSFGEEQPLEFQSKGEFMEFVYGGTEIKGIHCGVLKELKDRACAEDPDSVVARKLCVVHVLELLIYPKTSDKCLVSPEGIFLADDPDRFNSFPWGSHLYNRFINEWEGMIKNYKDKENSEKVGSKRNHYRISIWPNVMQAWLVECLGSSFSKYIAYKKQDNEGSIPRITRWKIREASQLNWKTIDLTIMKSKTVRVGYD